MKRQIQTAFRYFGYEVHRIAGRRERWAKPPNSPAEMNPIWPLPRDEKAFSNQQTRDEFEKFDAWHYAYEFQGGLSFPRRYSRDQAPQDSRRPLQRFRHFMPHLLASQNGSLQGKRVLDIACNSGFWSLQCALLGANVVGFDARPELIEQANLVRRVAGVTNVEFRVLDFWNMSPESLGGKFDIVLCLGFLYHVPQPIDALRLVKAISRDYILLDTQICPSTHPVAEFSWEEPDDIRNANRSGIVLVPSRSALAMMFREIGVVESFEIPIRTADMPDDYREQRRASYLIKV